MTPHPQALADVRIAEFGSYAAGPHIGKMLANFGATVVHVESRARPDAEARAFLRYAASSLKLSARAHHRVLKIARTVADLAPSDRVDAGHIAEALRFRSA